MSRYTTGDVCGPCVTAQRDSPPRLIHLPLGFWFSETVAHALSIWDWATVLRGVHRHAQATQSTIAQQTGLSQATVSRLMAGKSAGCTIETALKLLDGLGAPRLLAGLSPKGLGHLAGTANPDVRPPQDQSEPAVRRREFGTTLMLAGLAIPLFGGTGTRRAADSDVNVINGLERPSDVVADLFDLDARHGGAALVDLAEARLSSINRQLGQVSLKPSDEPFVYAVVGEITAAAAWFAYEHGDLNRAQERLKDGLYAAHCAGDAGLRFQVLDTMAMVARAKDEPVKAVAIAQGALDTERPVDPQLRALLAMRIALGHARLGDEARYESFRGTTWDLLGKAGSSPLQDEWFRFFGESEVLGLEAIAQGYLGHYARSAALLCGITASMQPRNRAYYRVLQADALALSGEIGEAIRVFDDNLALLTEMTSARITRKIRNFAATLQGNPRDDARQTCRMAFSLIGAPSHA
ncbi:helix-turn-helix domain-containing protein [Actinomadura barringtoniae]|uniref:Helix-turn-helix domain-containing protein n=1 Tax=Actinomadura barringtoniae TaxID=1427535 RepID=A0A939PFR2_9ACTN|nr:helix-turn-helix transcriptional regulator [Actinomadura barringtoniae]MBO2448369.1 helix-turn-helix domain-containing protein [Actinomadura barringtoniae]